MEQWVEFAYRDFWDVPRILIARLPDGRTIMLDCRFDDDREHYDDVYQVYLMRSDVDPSVQSWVGLESKAERCLGEVPVRSVEFDPTSRQRLFLGSPALSLVLTK